MRFARAYLSGASSKELAPLLAPGTRVPPRGATVPGVEVEQAEVAGSEAVSHGQAIVTVACELADARTVYLAVPTVREGADGVAAAGAPAVVAGPAGVGEDVASPRPIAGPDATAIGELVRRFLPAYFSASDPADLSYLLAPGAVVVPPGNGLRLAGVPAVKQIGEGEGARRTVLATVRVRDPLSGARASGLPTGSRWHGMAWPLVRRPRRGGAVVRRRFAVASTSKEGQSAISRFTADFPAASLTARAVST